MIPDPLPLSPEERLVAAALQHVRYPMGGGDRGFARMLAGALERPVFMSPAQHAYLWRLRIRYRRQLPDSLPMGPGSGTGQATGSA